MEHSPPYITVEDCPHCASAGYPGRCRYCDGKKKDCISFQTHCLFRDDGNGGEYRGFYDFTLPPCVDGRYPLVEWHVKKEK